MCSQTNRGASVSPFSERRNSNAANDHLPLDETPLNSHRDGGHLIGNTVRSLPERTVSAPANNLLPSLSDFSNSPTGIFAQHPNACVNASGGNGKGELENPATDAWNNFSRRPVRCYGPSWFDDRGSLHSSTTGAKNADGFGGPPCNGSPCSSFSDNFVGATDAESIRYGASTDCYDNRADTMWYSYPELPYDAAYFGKMPTMAYR